MELASRPTYHATIESVIARAKLLDNVLEWLDLSCRTMVIAWLQLRRRVETVRLLATYDLHVVELARTLTHRPTPR